jgi:2-C-methyl-D-erythritol 4-phosphate cytidylyltransferase
MAKAIVLAGGKGTRLKSSKVPKQYISVCGEMIISYVLENCLCCPEIQEIIIAADERWRDSILKEYENISAKDDFSMKPLSFSDPGETRQLSIYNALLSIEDSTSDDDIVAILDAARPNTSADILSDVINEAKMHDGALPVLPMKDTVYFSQDGKRVSKLIPREKLFAGQAPEAFKYKKYFLSNTVLLPDKILEINGSSEPAVLAGLDIALIKGNENNFKITTDEDLKRFEASQNLNINNS